jgi:hypothetical protein
MKQIQHLLSYGLIISCLLAVSCGTGKDSPNHNPSLDEFSPADDAGRGTATVQILPGNLYESLDPASLSVQWSERDGQSVATIETDAATDLRALYLRLAVPNGINGNATITPGDWAGEEALSLAVPSADNTIDIGICMLHPDTVTGYSGSATLATIEFVNTGLAVARSTSAPPLSAASRINFGYDSYRNNFAWYYRNQGDYNQNGEVGISDLTPIAVHFGKSQAGGFAESSVESVVDGDGNGIINISDISPIGVGFGRRVTSFNIYKGLQSEYPAGPDAASGIAELQSTAFADALNSPADGRLYFDVDNTVAVDSAAAYWLRPVDNATEGIPSDIAGLGNQRPTASFTLADNVGVAPFQINADASASTDPEGGELEYFWFVVPSGLFETQFDKPGSVLLKKNNVAAGDWSVVLYVRDEDGAMDFAALQLGVAASAGWQIADVDIAAPGTSIVEIEDIALAGIDNRPYIAAVYETATKSVVTLGYSASPLWDTVLDFRRLSELADGVSGQVEILDADGVPGVVSLQSGGGIRNVDYNYVEDQVFSAPLTIFTSNSNNLRDISTAMTDGRPSVAIFDRTASDVFFALSDDAIGSNWGSIGVVAMGSNLGWNVSLGIIDGSPAMAFFDVDNDQVRFMDSHLDSGNVVWHVHFPIFATTGIEIGDAVLELPGAGQWVLLHDYQNSRLLSLRDNGFATQDEVVATQGDSDTQSSSAIIGGRVCIAYSDDAKLKFIRSTDDTAAAWEAVQIVANQTTEDSWLSLADVAGHPAVAYVDDLTATAHYAVLLED